MTAFAAAIIKIKMTSCKIYDIMLHLKRRMNVFGMILNAEDLQNPLILYILGGVTFNESGYLCS